MPVLLGIRLFSGGNFVLLLLLNEIVLVKQDDGGRQPKQDASGFATHPSPLITGFQ